MFLLSKIFQIIISAILVVLILIQSKSAGLTSGLKGSFNMYRSLRGVERGVFILTIVLGVLLVINSIVIVLLS
jgi:protein translocase SecG subunit